MKKFCSLRKETIEIILVFGKIRRHRGNKKGAIANTEEFNIIKI